MTAERTIRNHAGIAMGEHTTTVSKGHIREIVIGEVHHLAPVTHLHLRMVKQRQDDHAAHFAPLLILVLAKI